jgi:hypothetical protein
MKTSANKITREARIVVALLIASAFVLAWWITEAGKLGDTYGQLVLIGALVFISATGSYIVTSELRDVQSRKTRKTLNKYHTQQVTQLSDAIYKLERDNARLAHNSFDTIEQLSNEIDALKLSLETATQNENGLLNLVRLACYETVEGSMNIDGIKFLGSEEGNDDKYEQMVGDLNACMVIDGGELSNDRLSWYAQAFHNGEGVGLGDVVKRDRLIEKANYACDGGDPVIDEPNYTYSATDALILGTLDKAYTITNEYGRETVYPLA